MKVAIIAITLRTTLEAVQAIFLTAHSQLDALPAIFVAGSNQSRTINNSS